MSTKPDSYQLLFQDAHSEARRGIFYTRRGAIDLPLFCPVATQASIKSIDSMELKNLGVQMILANAYHLHLRPGDHLIYKQGGLHSFMNWFGPILTDSGGYQVFSLSKISNISDEGVLFKNHLDGKEINITPESSMEIQTHLGSDIIMAFDHCPQGDISKKETLISLERTFNWLKRSHLAFLNLKEKGVFSIPFEDRKFSKDKNELFFIQQNEPALFGIVQGGVYKDLRQISLEQVESLQLPGIAVGGVSVGESKEKMYEVLRYISEKLPKNKPRYLMGVGAPEDLIYAVDCGFDLFDCVLPTRTARTGRLWTWHGPINIRNEKYKEDSFPVDPSCSCLCCSQYSRSYLRHLFLSRELLSYRLATLHNIYFYMELMKEIRQSIENSKWPEFRDKTLKQLKEEDSLL